MSDSELNELSAVKVMGWEISKYAQGIENEVWVVIPKHKDETENYVGTLWNPTTDMNDAMLMWDKLHSDGWELSLSCDQKVTYPWDCRMFLLERKRVIAHEKTPSRAITIASILALE